MILVTKKGAKLKTLQLFAMFSDGKYQFEKVGHGSYNGKAQLLL